jgi:hypothetical protein
LNEPFPYSETITRIRVSDSDPVVRYRLQRDVLRVSVSDLSAEKMALDANPWVQQLIREQRPDGSWGRFHSRDSTAKQKIITTEFGVDRGLALGLDASHPAFCRVVDYLTQLLSGQTDFPDPAEGNDRWLVGVGLFSAATLALLKPNHPFLDDAWDLWAEIAARTFKNGGYDPEAEIQAHTDLTGATIKDSYLMLNNKYALTLLSARIDDLPEALVAQIVAWVWNCSQGIRYLGVPPAKLPVDMNPGILDRWFSTHELLSRFPAWRDLAGDVIDWLLAGRGADGLWDFGSHGAGSYYFPLSPNWRKSIYRKFDWSTRVLVLLSRYQTGQM